MKIWEAGGMGRAAGMMSKKDRGRDRVKGKKWVERIVVRKTGTKM